MKKLPLYLAISLSLFGGLGSVRAGEASHKEITTNCAVSEFPFQKGDWEFQKLGTVYFGIETTSAKRPDINDAGGNLRLGLMLTHPKGHGWLRGNTELLFDAYGTGVFAGSSGALAGGNLLLRYNFIQPETSWIPYLQIGAGGLYDTVYRDRVQRLIGNGFEFNLQAAVGLRYMVSQKMAVTAEAGYRHISNADIAPRNLGLNSLGGSLGVSCFY